MTKGAFTDWLRNIWTGQPRARVTPVFPPADYDGERLRHLIEDADPSDPRTLEELAARLGQTDPSRI